MAQRKPEKRITGRPRRYSNSLGTPDESWQNMVSGGDKARAWTGRLVGKTELNDNG
jgi:hypothetical protein